MGMQIKYALALTLSHNAELLILDEPTSGLDPASRENLLKENAVIYSAVEENSPYHHLVDYIQYVIIVRDSDSAIPLER